jgi:hypothetical protein
VGEVNKSIRKITIIAFCLAFWFLLPGFGPAIAVRPSQTPDTKAPSIQVGQGLNLIKSDEESIVLELSTPAFQVNEESIDGTIYRFLSIEGYGETSEEGRPQLPVKGVMLGVPSEAKFEVRVLEAGSSIIDGLYNVGPVPKVVIREDPYGLESFQQLYGLSSKSMKYVFTKDEGVYSTDGFYPAKLVEVTSSGYLRDQRFVQLQLHPLQYNPVSQQLRFHKRMKVELRFSYDESKAMSAAGTVEIGSSFEEVMRNAFINYEPAKKWRHKAIAELTTSIRGENPPASQLSYKITVDQDGIYKLTYDDLLDAGVDVDTVDPRTFKLYNQGHEIAIYVVGESDGVFNTDDYILFYGQKMNTKYTDTNVYWLTTGGSNGSRMFEKDGSLTGGAFVPPHFMATAHAEQNGHYQSRIPKVEGADHWFWELLLASSSPVTGFYTATLNNIASVPYSPTIRFSMHGLTEWSANPDHHSQISFNGHLLDDFTWDGQVEYLFEMDVPHSYLIEGDNIITITLPLDLAGVSYEMVCTNWFEIDYYDTYVAENDSLLFSGDEAGAWEYHVEGFTTGDIETFDVTDPVHPSRIINAAVESGSSYTLKFQDTISARREYVALTTAQRLSPPSIVLDTPSDLYSTSNSADYIIITHSDFYTDVLPLANHRAAQGPRTMIIDVQDIYDEFSYGIFDPQAIHDFLAYAYEYWTEPSLSYVLLVGDGSYDFKNYLGYGEVNYIPPYLAMVDPFTGEAATDNRYVTVSGDDIVPDMNIGRLPVQTSTEADVVINKILDYEQSPPTGDWNEKVLFVADNADAAGSFDIFSDDIADNYLPAAYAAQKVYLGVNYPYENPSVAATNAVTAAINSGCLLVNYIGHGAVTYWAAEKLLSVPYMTYLSNGGELPMMLPMTCYEGIFDHFSVSCLGEAVVKAEGKGAIASWSPTGAGLALGHHYLDQGFFTAVFTDTISEIGQATYLGKLKLYTETGGEASAYRDLIDTFVLFGDPFMKLNLPACDAADFDNDRQITVADIMQVAVRWDTEWGDENYDRKYDIDDDGDVDIVDVMRVATLWDTEC